MSGAWKLSEARLVQERALDSAINAEVLAIGYPGPPQGKLWVVTGVKYMPSVAETQVIAFEKLSSAGTHFALLNPVSMALNLAVATFIEQGMEYILFPGEYILVRRGGHTVGSTMAGALQLIEIDLPLYTYDEPQIVKRIDRALTSVRERIGSAMGGGGRAATGPIPPARGPGGGRER